MLEPTYIILLAYTYIRVKMCALCGALWQQPNIQKCRAIRPENIRRSYNLYVEQAINHTLNEKEGEEKTTPTPETE